MKELLVKIEALIAEFNKDANAQMENGNKSAGIRARKASLEIEKLMKDFRKVSLIDSKK
ncbi:histone H1 [uncultured Bacteroides sp.]|uniref:histone H1 n=1 Tax=uncultured Bacteroides sp. TaxID=162156 RepID=UPI002AAC0934|nr:histone H1 [uncultured Bacteroides sp.]